MLAQRLKRAQAAAEVDGPQPRRGAEIFEGDYPCDWSAFVGQERAKEHLQAAISSARARGRRLDHVLIASGMAGVGKTSLARLVAGSMGAGFQELSGTISVDEARPALQVMEPGDVLFIDEIHQVSGVKGEWLLHLLQDGRLLTGRGAEPMPDITVVAATTDPQRLPRTILDRFVIRPTLAPYTDEEAVRITCELAARLGFGSGVIPTPEPGDLLAMARAGNNSPRSIRALLATYRDTRFAGGEYSLDLALTWAGTTRDGLDNTAQEYLLVLAACEGQASLATISGQMGEPGPLRHTEALLGMRGYVTIEGRGRKLTTAGVQRVGELMVERGLVERDTDSTNTMEGIAS